MIPQIDVRSNIMRVKAQFSAIADGLEETAIARALNRAGDQAVTEAKRRIRDTYNVSYSLLGRQIKIRSKAGRGVLVFTVRFFSKRLPVAEFRTRKGKEGMRVEIRKGHGLKLIPHTFRATMGSGHEGIFARANSSKGARPGDVGRFRFGPGSGEKRRKWGRPDLPIAELFGPDVPTMFLEKNVRAAAVKMAVESFEKNFKQQVQFLTGAAGGG